MARNGDGTITVKYPESTKDTGTLEPRHGRIIKEAQSRLWASEALTKDITRDLSEAEMSVVNSLKDNIPRDGGSTTTARPPGRSWLPWRSQTKPPQAESTAAAIDKYRQSVLNVRVSIAKNRKLDPRSEKLAILEGAVASELDTLQSEAEKRRK